jgi:hypothetical protein
MADRSWRAASSATFRRSAELWMDSAGALAYVALFVLLAVSGRLWDPSLVGDILAAAVAIAALASLTSGFARARRWAAWTQRRQLSDEAAAAAGAKADIDGLPAHVYLGGPQADEYGDAYGARRDAANSRAERAAGRLADHGRRGRSVRVRFRWTLVIVGYGLGLAVLPWVTWAGAVEASQGAIVLAVLAELAAVAALLRSLPAFWRTRDDWPPEVGEAPNARSLSPVYGVFAAPALVAYLWNVTPGTSWQGPALAAAFAALALTVGLRKALASTTCARLEAAWLRGPFGVQRRLERLGAGALRAVHMATVVLATLLLALAVAFGKSSASILADALSTAMLLAVLASLLGQLCGLRVDRDGQMIPASSIYDTIENHPLSGYGLVAVFTLLAGAAAAI